MNRLTIATAILALAATSVFAAEEEEPGFNEATFKGLEFRSIGPAFMSGRIADIAIHPERQSTWYVAVGSGNVWKTTNAGTTWTPIFDDQGVWQGARGVEVVLLGCGPAMAWVDPALKQALRRHGPVLEAMDSGAACRTYNILLSEERRVAAALIAID